MTRTLIATIRPVAEECPPVVEAEESAEEEEPAEAGFRATREAFRPGTVRLNTAAGQSAAIDLKGANNG